MTTKDLFERSGLAVADIVGHTGLHKSTVSQVINDKYPGKQKVIEQVVGVIRSALPDAYQSEVEFEMTPGQKQGWTILELARRNKNMAVVLGQSGTGKTTLMRHYTKTHADATVLTARMGQTPADLTRAVCWLWNIGASGTNTERMERILTKAPGQFLIVDEADLLMEGRQQKHVIRLVELFRLIYEAGAGVVLLGLPSLYDNLVRAGETYVFSRIAYMRKAPPPDKAFMERVWRRLVADYPQALEMSGPVVEDANRRGYFRYLEMLAEILAVTEGDMEAALGLAFRPEQG